MVDCLGGPPGKAWRSRLRSCTAEWRGWMGGRPTSAAQRDRGRRDDQTRQQRNCTAHNGSPASVDAQLRGQGTVSCEPRHHLGTILPGTTDLRQVAGVVHRAQQQRAAVRHQQAVHLKPWGICNI